MIGILSDAHGNHFGFHAAISHLRSLGAKKFYFLGDAVGYIPSLEVVKYLFSMESDVKCISGNHEKMLFEAEKSPNKEAIYQHQIVRNGISMRHESFLKSWPDYRKEMINTTSVMFIHGSPSDYTNGYVYPDTDLTQFHCEASIVFMGHSHYPFIRESSGTIYVNVGSCGMPRDDGRFGSACLYNPISNDMKIIRFDIYEGTQKILLEHPSVHPSVYDILERRKPFVFGDAL